MLEEPSVLIYTGRHIINLSFDFQLHFHTYIYSGERVPIMFAWDQHKGKFIVKEKSLFFFFLTEHSAATGYIFV